MPPAIPQGCGLPMCYGWVEWLQCSVLATLGYAAALPMVPLAAHQIRLLPYRHAPESPIAEEVSSGAGLWRPAPRNEGRSGASQRQQQQQGQRPETQSSPQHRHPQHSRVSCSEVEELRPDVGMRVGNASERRAQAETEMQLARAVEEVTVQLLMFDATRDFQLFQKVCTCCRPSYRS